MMGRDSARFLSRPIGVEWAGWRSDTQTLQQNGWEIAVEFDMYRPAYRLLMRHRMCRLYALTDAASFDHFMDVTDPSYDHRRLPVFRVQAVAQSMEVVRMHDNFSNFQQVDAQPCMVTQEVQRIEDMNIFNVPLQRAEELVVDKADQSVIKHLQAIKELQSPEQARIRERIRREGATPPGAVVDAAPKTEVIANVVTFAA